MPDDLFQNLKTIEQRLSAVDWILIFCDFDGTLTPIRSHPAECRLDHATRRALVNLNQCPNVRIAVVSGRRLDDVRQQIGIEGLSYAGNHGLEIEGPDLQLQLPQQSGQPDEFTRIVKELSDAVSELPGAWVENKHLSATVHFREMPPEHIGFLSDAVNAICNRGVRSSMFRIHSGRKVLEVRPASDWNKGHAVRWLADRLIPAGASHALFYFGDDVTDEDVFTAFPDSLTVQVGSRTETAARYRTPGPDDVCRFLEWLKTIVAPHPARATHT